MQSQNPLLADFVKLANSAAGTFAGMTREARETAREGLLRPERPRKQGARGAYQEARDRHLFHAHGVANKNLRAVRVDKFARLSSGLTLRGCVGANYARGPPVRSHPAVIMAVASSKIRDLAALDAMTWP